MAAETADDTTSLQQAIARKRRLEARKRSHDSKHSVVGISSPEKVTSYQHLSLSRSTKRASYQQRNTQVRYSPDVPMTEEELASWRRDQRRIRNRDSAATTRRKTRELISELQNAADQWRKKYEKLEAENADLLKKLQNRGVLDVSTDSMSKAVIPVPPSPELTSITDATPIVTEENVLDDCCGEAMIKGQQHEPKQHLTEMISRPAVKIADVAIASAKRPYLFLPPPVMTLENSCNTIAIVGDENTEEDCVVLDQYGCVVRMDPMLYDALSGLIEEDM